MMKKGLICEALILGLLAQEVSAIVVSTFMQKEILKIDQ